MHFTVFYILSPDGVEEEPRELRTCPCDGQGAAGQPWWQCWDPRVSPTSQCPPTAGSCRGCLQCGPHGINAFPGPVWVNHKRPLLQASPAAAHSTDLALVRSTPALAGPGLYSTSNYKGLEQSDSINCGFLTMDPQKAKLF